MPAALTIRLGCVALIDFRSCRVSCCACNDTVAPRTLCAIEGGVGSSEETFEGIPRERMM